MSEARPSSPILDSAIPYFSLGEGAMVQQPLRDRVPLGEYQKIFIRMHDFKGFNVQRLNAHLSQRPQIDALRDAIKTKREHDKLTGDITQMERILTSVDTERQMKVTALALLGRKSQLETAYFGTLDRRIAHHLATEYEDSDKFANDARNFPDIVANTMLLLRGPLLTDQQRVDLFPTNGAEEGAAGANQERPVSVAANFGVMYGQRFIVNPAMIPPQMGKIKVTRQVMRKVIN